MNKVDFSQYTLDKRFTQASKLMYDFYQHYI